MVRGVKDGVMEESSYCGEEAVDEKPEKRQTFGRRIEGGSVNLTRHMRNRLEG